MAIATPGRRGRLRRSVLALARRRHGLVACSAQGKRRSRRSASTQSDRQRGGTVPDGPPLPSAGAYLSSMTNSLLGLRAFFWLTSQSPSAAR